MDHYDAVIVGNGVIGLFLASELAQREPDAAIAIIGPSAPLGSASRAAAAMLGCFGEVTKDTLATDAARSKFDIGVAAHRRWPEVLDALADATGEQPHRVTGTHVVLNTRSGELDTLNFLALIDAVERYDEPWEEVDPRDVPALAPVPDSRPLRALHLPDEWAVDGNQVIRLLVRVVTERGVTMVDDRAASLAEQGGGLVARLASGGAVSADKIVVSAGAWSADVLRTLLPVDRVLPMFSGAGVACVGQRVAGPSFQTVVRTPSRSGSCGLHLVPLPDGREYIGATNVVYASPQLHGHAGIQHALLGYALDQLDQSIFFHRVEEWRIGNRPITLDGLPVAGATDIDGVYVVSGTYRDGFHCAPVLAELLVDELLGAGAKLPPTFAPGRRPLLARTIDEAIEEFVLHNSASWFEESGVVPRHLTTALLSEVFDLRARALHAELGLEAGLAPEILDYLLDARDSPAEGRALAEYLSATR